MLGEDDQGEPIMSIKLAILGFLSWKPLTGYEIKKLFADSPTLYWSGNNNQIYRALLELHQDELVTQVIQYQIDHPSRKVYTITEEGCAELRRWVLAEPELPQLRNSFLIQLAWADQLPPEELDALIVKYEEEVRVQLLMLQTQARRKTAAPDRTPREGFLWDMMLKNWISFYEHELEWVRALRSGLAYL